MYVDFSIASADRLHRLVVLLMQSGLRKADKSHERQAPTWAVDLQFLSSTDPGHHRLRELNGSSTEGGSGQIDILPV